MPGRRAHALALLCLATAALGAPAPVVKLRGTDFRSGGAATFGSVHAGEARVNYVYAAPTGELSAMVAAFTLDTVPAGGVLLHVRGRLDDGGTPCPIRITLNDAVVWEGPDGFPHDTWQWRSFPLGDGVLREGPNRLEIRNTSADGQSGMPPWCMVAACVIGPKDCDLSTMPSIEEDFWVTLPTEQRPLPEPLPAGRSEPGFRLRGIKGWLWRPEQYLAEIPFLSQCKMNFLMNCYGSMCDIEHYGFGSPQCNRWWEPLPGEKKDAYARVVRACQERGIQFCFSLNPNLGASRILRYESAEDFDLLWQHYEWMQGLGVRWHNIQFDDISQGIDAAGQSRFANRLLEKLRTSDPEAQLILCPTYYWGVGETAEARAYLETLARDLHPDVFVFWTGPSVVSPAIPRSAAEAYRALVGHRLIIWDNYPVNDGNPTLHLGPVIGRDADLCEAAEGFMANPMHTESEIGRIPLLTVADYAYNPFTYDPARSIGQAIVHTAATSAQREVLRDLVELYPGMLLYRQGTGYNPLLGRFQQVVDTPHSRWLASLMLAHADDVLLRLEREFPERFAPTRQTMARNVKAMQDIYRGTYGPEGATAGE